MYDCVNRGRRAMEAELEAKKCGMREIQGSHGGGTDYSPECVLHTNDRGRHKGDHRAANGYSWRPGPNDRRI